MYFFFLKGNPTAFSPMGEGGGWGVKVATQEKKKEKNEAL